MSKIKKWSIFRNIWEQGVRRYYSVQSNLEASNVKAALRHGFRPAVVIRGHSVRWWQKDSRCEVSGAAETAAKLSGLSRCINKPDPCV